jgi:hypothetical protein
VLQVAELTYLASAGVRMLIFARQRMSPGVEIYVITPARKILNTNPKRKRGRLSRDIKLCR